MGKCRRESKAPDLQMSWDYRFQVDIAAINPKIPNSDL